LKKEPIFVSASDLSDESLLRYYNSIRKQVEADRDSKHKFMGGDTIKEYAKSLRLELYKRRLPYTAIDWSGDQQANTPPKSDVRCDRNPVTEPPEAETEEKRTEPIEATESDVRDPPIDPADEADPIDLTDQAVDRVDQIDPAEQAVEPVDPVEQLKRRIKAFMNRSD
jgi:hypothetical protein